jgi:uncharacterized integral membrane protein
MFQGHAILAFSEAMELVITKSEPDQAGDSLLPTQSSNLYLSSEERALQNHYRHKEPRPWWARNSIQEILSSWLYFAAAVLFLVLTALYAAQIPLSSKFTFVYNSSSNTIFVLSLLSGITGLLLTAVIGIAFENLQWLLLARRQGIRATDFLALHPGTGVPGLLALVFRNGQPLSATSRSWSIVRLLTTAVPPILGVLIMSNDTKLNVYKALLTRFRQR